MALIQSFALSLAIDADAAFEAARQGGKNVAAKAAIRVNVITLIKDQTTPVIVSTVGDGRDHLTLVAGVAGDRGDQVAEGDAWFGGGVLFHGGVFLRSETRGLGRPFKIVEGF